MRSLYPSTVEWTEMINSGQDPNTRGHAKLQGNMYKVVMYSRMENVRETLGLSVKLCLKELKKKLCLGIKISANHSVICH